MAQPVVTETCPDDDDDDDDVVVEHSPKASATTSTSLDAITPNQTGSHVDTPSGDDSKHQKLTDGGADSGLVDANFVKENFVATPCRAPGGPPAKQAAVNLDQTPSPPLTPTVLEASSPETIPGIDDQNAAKPDPRSLRISEAAADARLRRVFQPSLRTGQYKVSDQVLAQYKKNGKGRKSLMKLFETCGYCKDRVSNLESLLGVVV